MFNLLLIAQTLVTICILTAPLLVTMYRYKTWREFDPEITPRFFLNFYKFEIVVGYFVFIILAIGIWME